MNEPKCAWCHASTMSADERTRFYASAPQTPIYYCPPHQEQVDELMGRVIKSLWG